MTDGVLLLDKPLVFPPMQPCNGCGDFTRGRRRVIRDPGSTCHRLVADLSGEATKFSHALLDADKSYEASIRLDYQFNR